MTELAGLIARLEGGETGREVEVAIYRALAKPDKRWADVLVAWTPDETWHWMSRFESDWCSVSTSLDAAVALAEKVLPEHNWCAYKHGYAQITLRGNKGHGGSFDAIAPTPAAALVAALLRAREPEGQ